MTYDAVISNIVAIYVTWFYIYLFTESAVPSSCRQ